jgi:alpha-D-xyloside xylohydrolase
MKRSLLTTTVLFALPLSALVSAQTIEFFTPQTVRVLRDNGKTSDQKSLVVISTPEKVKVTKKTVCNATIYKSSALTVTV